MRTIIYGRIRTELAASHCSRASVHSARLNVQQHACYSQLYLLYLQTTSKRTHTFLRTPPPTCFLSLCTDRVFNHREKVGWWGVGGLEGGAAVGRKLFCHWHPTVILWLITPALRLNRDASIPGSMVLADMHRSASHIAPEVLQTSGDNVSLREKRGKEKGEICPKHRAGHRTGVTLLPLGRTYLQAFEKERKKKHFCPRILNSFQIRARSSGADNLFLFFFSFPSPDKEPSVWPQACY